MPEILMYADIVDVVIRLFQNGAVPFGIGIAGHERAAAGHGLDRRVHRLHGLRGLVRQAAVLLRRFLPQLVRRAQLIPQAPRPDPVGLLPSVLSAQPGVVGIGVQIAVLQLVQCVLDPAGGEIQCHHHLAPDLLAPSAELLHAEGIGLDALPGQLHPPLPLGDGSHAVLPVITGCVSSAGVAVDGDLQLWFDIKRTVQTSHSFSALWRART